VIFLFLKNVAVFVFLNLGTKICFEGIIGSSLCTSGSGKI